MSNLNLRKKKIIKLLLITIIIISLSASGIFMATYFSEKKNNDGNNNNGEFEYPFEESLEYLIKTHMNQENIQGITTCIIKNDSLVWTHGYGYADAKANISIDDYTVFPIASISKTITTVAIMHLYEQGLFQLLDNISNYLPFDIFNPFYPNDSITFEMLLTHTASLAHDVMTQNSFLFCSNLSEDFTLEGFIEESFSVDGSYYGVSNFISEKPGSTYSYSNAGFAILGLLVEEISGISFEEYCQQNIFDPLQMNQTSWHMTEKIMNNLTKMYGEHGVRVCYYTLKEFPAGNLYTNIIDLSHFLRMLMKNGKYNGISILNESTIELMKTSGSVNYGLGLMHLNLYGNNVIGHNGMVTPGPSTLMFFNPESDVGVIYFVNRDNALHYDVLDRLFRIGAQYF
ncbi:MAG: serine hydrolase domain-containing protein [Promethearchaeota archaeon]